MSRSLVTSLRPTAVAVLAAVSVALVDAARASAASLVLGGRTGAATTAKLAPATTEIVTAERLRADLAARGLPVAGERPTTPGGRAFDPELDLAQHEPPPGRVDDFKAPRGPLDGTDDLAGRPSAIPEFDFATSPAFTQWLPWASAAEIDAVIADGYRIVDLEVRATAPYAFSAVLTRNDGAFAQQSWWLPSATGAEVVAEIDQKKGRLVQLKPRVVNGALRFSAVFVANTGVNYKPWVWYHSATSIAAIFAETDPIGHRVIDLEAYYDQGDLRFSAVAIANQGADYRKTLVVTSYDLGSFRVGVGEGMPAYRMVDLEKVEDLYVGILSDAPAAPASVEHGRRHWYHHGITQAEVVRLAKRHWARVTDVEATAVDLGSNQWLYDVVLVDNGMHASGPHFPGFAAIDGVMIDTMKRNGIPGAAVAVVENGKLVYTRGFGWADLEKNALATPETVFRMGSISKPMTAIAVMRLMQQGAVTLWGGPLTLDTQIFKEVIFPHLDQQLGLPTPLGHLYPELTLITLRDLLHHAGGWYEQGDLYPGDPAHPVYLPLNDTHTIAQALGIEHTPTDLEIVEFMIPKPLQAAPGTRFYYSGFGFTVIAAAIEILTGKTYEDYFLDEVAGPLEMNAGQVRFGYSSDFYAEKADTEARFYDPIGAAPVVPLLIELADGFDADGWPLFDAGNRVPQAYGGTPQKSILPAGAWAASPLALARIGTAIERSRRPYLLDYAQFVAMSQDQSVAQPDGGRFGLGFGVTAAGSLVHGGSVAGGWAQYHWGANGRSWVAMFNAQPHDPTFAGRMRDALAQVAPAIAGASWDLYPQYGFVEPEIEQDFEDFTVGW